MDPAATLTPESFSPLHLFLHADWVVKGVLVGLLLASLAAVDDRHPGIGVIDRIAIRIGIEQAAESLFRRAHIPSDNALGEYLFCQRVIEQLPPEDFEKLSAWVARRCAAGKPQQSTAPVRDHTAFLNSYAPEDEGLYDDAQGRWTVCLPPRKLGAASRISFGTLFSDA